MFAKLVVVVRGYTAMSPTGIREAAVYGRCYVADNEHLPTSCLQSAEGIRAPRCVALLLPRDVSRRVFSQLDYRDLFHCSLVCKQWLLESTELRHGWKEEYWEACSVRGVHFANSDSPRLPHFELYLAGSPD